MTKNTTISSRDNIYPDRTRCLQYLKDYGTPEHVIRHCEGVTGAALRIADALNVAGGTRAPEISDVTFETFVNDRNHTGYRINKDETKLDGTSYRMLDIGLIEAAGLLHDMARVEDRHWDAAADYFENEGYPDIGKVIRVHMQYEFTADAEHLTEADMVCLGDRLVLEDRYVGIDDRMDYIIAKAERAGNYDAKPAILRKKEETKVLLRQIESRIGKTLDELLAGDLY